MMTSSLASKRNGVFLRGCELITAGVPSVAGEAHLRAGRLASRTKNTGYAFTGPFYLPALIFSRCFASRKEQTCAPPPYTTGGRRWPICVACSKA